MPSVAPGVEELRILDRAGIYRVFYYAKARRGLLVVHAFMKKSRTTPSGEVTLGRRRLKEMLDET